MTHKPIQIKNLSFTLPHKTCFEGFNVTIPAGERIAIIGRNGSGKSSLLQMLLRKLPPSQGEIFLPENIQLGFVPQVIQELNTLSGGQRFQKKLTQVLSRDPDLLLLDEPTNHLDTKNRKSLLRMLQAYSGTLLVATHDPLLLRNCINKIWHIDQERVKVFSGNYDDYLNEIRAQRTTIEAELSQLQREKKIMHDKLMKEQVRASKSRTKGEKSIDQHKWAGVVSKTKLARGQETSGRKKSEIENKKQSMLEHLSELRLPVTIEPDFYLEADQIDSGNLLSVHNGKVAYGPEVILTQIYFSVSAHERIAILGENGSGKSTLVKAFLNDSSITTCGEWCLPKTSQIGYLDQHYGTLPLQKTVLESLISLVPNWPMTQVRRHLSQFLFHDNSVVETLVAHLSGGEKARLSLAHIAAKYPRLLILDEITNNLDLETREHVIQVLKAYPGAMIVISHDEAFLKEIKIQCYYVIQNGQLKEK